MFAETPKKVRLVGALGAPETASLVDYCDRLSVAGRTALQVDMGGVSDCGVAGLHGLVALSSGSSTLAVTIQGARWGQFMMVLAAAPIVEVQPMCDAVRRLINAGSPDARARRPRHRQWAADASAARAIRAGAVPSPRATSHDDASLATARPTGPQG